MASFTRGPVVTVDPSLTSATISWSADMDSYGQVDFGLNQANLDGSLQDLNYGPDHSVLLQGLQVNQIYTFVVSILDSNGAVATNTGNLTFSTTAAPVAITDGPTSNASIDTAEIAWSVSVDCAGVINLGVSQTNLTQVLTDPTVSQDHAVTAQGLTAGTQYFYKCSNVDPATGTVLVESTILNFNTQPAPPPTGGCLRLACSNLRRVPKNGTSQLSVFLFKGITPIKNAPVTFEMVTHNGQIVVSGQAGTSGTVNTDAKGKAVVAFKAGNVRGFVLVKITSPSAVNKAFIALLIRRV